MLTMKIEAIIEPDIAMKKRKKSVKTTPLNPPKALNTTVIIPA
jgi:hypothetical protein